jgi:hypothetical protein
LRIGWLGWTGRWRLDMRDLWGWRELWWSDGPGVLARGMGCHGVWSGMLLLIQWIKHMTVYIHLI